MACSISCLRILEEKLNVVLGTRSSLLRACTFVSQCDSTSYGVAALPTESVENGDNKKVSNQKRHKDQQTKAETYKKMQKIKRAPRDSNPQPQSASNYSIEIGGPRATYKGISTKA
jgi:hypothetical protein